MHLTQTQTYIHINAHRTKPCVAIFLILTFSPMRYVSDMRRYSLLIQSPFLLFVWVFLKWIELWSNKFDTLFWLWFINNKLTDTAYLVKWWLCSVNLHICRSFECGLFWSEIIHFTSKHFFENEWNFCSISRFY